MPLKGALALSPIGSRAKGTRACRRTHTNHHTRAAAQDVLRQGGAAAGTHSNADLLPMMEEAVADEDFGERVFSDDRALAGLCARLHQVRCQAAGSGRARASPGLNRLRRALCPRLLVCAPRCHMHGVQHTPCMQREARIGPRACARPMRMHADPTAAAFVPPSRCSVLHTAVPGYIPSTRAHAARMRAQSCQTVTDAEEIDQATQAEVDFIRLGLSLTPPSVRCARPAPA